MLTMIMFVLFLAVFTHAFDPSFDISIIPPEDFRNNNNATSSVFIDENLRSIPGAGEALSAADTSESQMRIDMVYEL